MKKLTLTASIAMILILGTISASAQTETRIGALVAYGTEIENIGIGANAEFPITEKLTVSPSFIYFLPKDEFGIKVNWFEVNANANYYFLQEETISIYGLAGLNYTNVKTTFDGFDDLGEFGEMFDFGEEGEISDGRFGLNLGAGINYIMSGSITPFAELKYVIIDGSQLVIAAGVRFDL